MDQSNAVTAPSVTEERRARDMPIMRTLAKTDPSTNLSYAEKKFLAVSVVRPLRDLLKDRPALSLERLQEGNLECVEKLLSHEKAEVEHWPSASMRCLHTTRVGPLDYLKVVGKRDDPNSVATLHLRLLPEESAKLFPTLSGNCNSVQLLFEVSKSQTRVSVRTIASGDVIGKPEVDGEPAVVGRTVDFRPETLAQAGWGSHLSDFLFKYLAEPAIHHAIRGSDSAVGS